MDFQRGSDLDDPQQPVVVPVASVSQTWLHLSQDAEADQLVLLFIPELEGE